MRLQDELRRRYLIDLDDDGLASLPHSASAQTIERLDPAVERLLSGAIATPLEDECQEKRLILAEIDKRQNRAQDAIQFWSIAALGPPAVLLILGLIGAWIVQGFRTGGGNGAASNKD